MRFAAAVKDATFARRKQMIRVLNEFSFVNVPFEPDFSRAVCCSMTNASRYMITNRD